MVASPATPSLLGYVGFLYGVVGVPALNLPTASGIATGGSTTTLIDTVQAWTSDQWDGYALTDAVRNVYGYVSANNDTILTFAPALTTPIVAGNAYLIAPSVVPMSFSVAQEIVNPMINLGSCELYTLAVYNLAADRLLNYAMDVPKQTFFVDERAKLKISIPRVGVPSAASDQGTATGILNPEFMKTMTLRDLQVLKTEYGRAYMEIVLDWGPNTWGLT